MENNYEQIEKGLADVCRMLAKYSKTTQEQKETFLKYAGTFDKFSKFHNAIKINKEVKMVDQKTKHPTQEEIELKKVREVIAKFVALEKEYGQKIIKRACYKYKMAIVEKNKAEREIKVLENRLAQAKSKLK
jgi:hypothetical protein